MRRIKTGPYCLVYYAHPVALGKRALRPVTLSLEDRPVAQVFLDLLYAAAKWMTSQMDRPKRKVDVERSEGDEKGNPPEGACRIRSEEWSKKAGK
ncbi:hypothetical protein NDU88_006026 [Pleurodeles waltl]|uniref:Uncharacterized protein n=1 Tax=Pleurodeles waltl TaxID=8319 RepID=A0AAV7MB15_PLEWA|nr:hypothetical protein NDU88_006026 [Pleurodeles waltl]